MIYDTLRFQTLLFFAIEYNFADDVMTKLK